MSDDEKQFINDHLLSLSEKIGFDKRYDKNNFVSKIPLLFKISEYISTYIEIKKIMNCYDDFTLIKEIKKMISELDSIQPYFTITSGKVRVTDPCYDMDTWCAGDIENVRNGKWLAFIHNSDEKSWGIRVADLQVVEENFYNKGIQPNWVKINIHVGVDSGQAGVFDYGLFSNMEGECHKDDTERGKFYDNVCELTGGRRQFGVIDFGAVSSTGFGDGGYDCYIAKDGDEVVAIKIIYIGDEEDEYNEDEDECDID